MLVGLLGLVLLAMRQAQSPGFVAKLERVFGDEAVSGEAPPVRNASPLPQTLTALQRERFAAVQDNTFFREEETDAWFYVLGLLKGIEPNVSAPPATYAQLVSQPDYYRGQPVQVRGTIRRIEQVTPAANDLGIHSLHRMILQPQGGEVWPMTLYSIEPPSEAPAGDVRLPATATGYFFKNQSYRWQDGLGVTPVVLVRSVRFDTPAVASPADAPQELDPFTVIAAATGVSLCLLGWFLTRSRVSSPAASHAAHDGPIVIEIPSSEAE